MVRGYRYRRRIARPCWIASLLVTAALLGACGDSDDDADADERAEQVDDAATAAGLPEDVADLLADAAAGVNGTYRVVYEVADPAGGEPQRVAVIQRPPQRRLDIERADGTAEATIRTDETTHRCERAGADAPWTCARLPVTEASGIFDPAVIDALVESLRESADAYVFTVEDRTLVGIDARCLVTTRRPEVTDPALGASATLCLSPEGAQLLTEVPAGAIRAVEYDAEVGDDAFTLPT